MLRTVNGIPLRVLPGHRAYFHPAYDATVARLFRERLQPGQVCISVGSNRGVYPLQFANWTAPTGVVYAFEPNPVTTRILLQHVELNKLQERIRVIPCALGDHIGTDTFHAAGSDGMSRLGEPNPLIASETTAISVDVNTLDNFCETNAILPAALMIDVEGFEAAVLAGARHLFESQRGRLTTVVEMHSDAWTLAGTDRAGFEQLLRELRVRPVSLSGQVDPMADYGHVYLEPA